LYASYKDDPRVAMFLVYVDEAYPAADAPKHRSLAQRASAAKRCMERLKLSLPVLVDTMDGAARRAFDARWGATVVVDLQGKVTFHRSGAQGVQPAAAAAAIRSELEKAARDGHSAG
jgi:hypothetical protein